MCLSLLQVRNRMIYDQINASAEKIDSERRRDLDGVRHIEGYGKKQKVKCIGAPAPARSFASLPGVFSAEYTPRGQPSPPPGCPP